MHFNFPSFQTAAVRASVGETAVKEKAKSTTDAPAKEAESKPAEAPEESKEAAIAAKTRSRAADSKVTTQPVISPIPQTRCTAFSGTRTRVSLTLFNMMSAHQL